MTWLKVFVVIAFVFINLCVLAFEPSVHAPFVMEKKDFKLAKSYQEPKSTGNINLFKIGFSGKPVQDMQSGTELAPVDSAQPVTREVHIEPSEFYRQASGYGIRNVSNTRQKISERVKTPSENSGIQTRVENITNPVEEKPKKLTRREETIAWNNWRSSLQNRVMDESQIAAPMGTLVTFSFRVSSRKTISKIKVNCTNWGYSEKVREAMIPLIQSYAGKDFLAFPEGSERKFTDVKGAFLIWYETSYSSPDDYNDFERVHWYE